MQISAPVPSMASLAPGADVPPAVEAIVLRLLEKDPALRFQTAADAVAALTQAIVDLAAAGRIQPVLLSLADSSGPMSTTSKSLAGAIERLSVGAAPTRLPDPAPPRAARTPLMDVVDVLRPLAERARLAAHRYAPGVSVRAWIAAGAVLVFVATLTTALVTAYVWGKVADSSPPPPSSSSAAPAEPSAPDPLAAAEALLDKGDYAGAISRLTLLEQAHPDAAAIHHDLERAYLGAGDLGPALREGRSWLAGDRAAGRDAKFEEAVRSAALGTVAPDDAFALLETSMGTVGADILYDIAYGSGHAAASERARAALARPAVRGNASPALAVTLDLRAARSCDGKLGLLPRARAVGDERTSAVLKGYRATSGCGFIGKRDCWPCMHRDGSLNETLDALEARGPKP